MKLISELGDLTEKRVLVRVDFNVPVDENGMITDTFRIESHLPTIEYLLKKGANVVLVSHWDLGDTFVPLMDQISTIISRPIKLYPLTEESLITGENLIMLDNIRQDPREVKDDPVFAKELAEDFDIYVNDAFSVCHRKHASVSAITKFLPSYTGFLIEKETRKLTETILAPQEGKVLVLGGAKISTKLPVIKNFLDKAEKILIGGAIANNYFKSEGVDVGDSVVDETTEKPVIDPKIMIPEDVVISKDKKSLEIDEVKDVPGYAILDIGPKTTDKFVEIIKSAKMVVWNGPMGLFEIKQFSKATKMVAEAIVSVPVSIIGGGDSIAAANSLGLLDKFTFVSTGGGAMLEFLADTRLPGLEALGYYE